MGPPLRRRLFLPLLALPAFGAPAIAGGDPAAGQDSGDDAVWFDPTQLPSFTGTVERYLPNPRGQTDALLFREGPQVVFPPEVAEAVRRVAPRGQTLVVWGIRARKAPVITMLAFARPGDSTPTVVERPYWRRSLGDPQARMTRLAISGKVMQPYYSPQGEVVGAILEDGTVVMVPPRAAERLADLLAPGASLAAEGQGVAEGDRRALMAERIGADPATLRPIAVPAPEARPAPR